MNEDETDDSQPASKHDKQEKLSELEQAIADLDSYESEFSQTFRDLETDPKFLDEIAKIYDKYQDLDLLQAAILLLIKSKVKEIARRLKLDKKNEIKYDEETIIKDIARLSREMMAEKEEELEAGYGKMKRKDRYKLVTKKLSKAIKKIVKIFTVYKIYQVMNPKRIAGETKKENYAHNMLMGGEKLAKEYEGGRDHEVKQYSKSFIKKVKKGAKAFKKQGGGGLGL